MKIEQLKQYSNLYFVIRQALYTCLSSAIIVVVVGTSSRTQQAATAKRILICAHFLAVLCRKTMCNHLNLRCPSTGTPAPNYFSFRLGLNVARILY